MLTWFLSISVGFGQSYIITGNVKSLGGVLPRADVLVGGTDIGTLTDDDGNFTLSLPVGDYYLTASFVGLSSQTRNITVEKGVEHKLNFFLDENPSSLDEVTVSGTLTEVSRSESPVAVEVYQPSFFAKNPTSNLFEAISYVNGVRPQINCNVCSTGDIHINGLEGPYTMVLIDGMPILSGLSTVYGLMGIPNSMIRRTEIVKGPASSLYGSEAVGGLINVITKSPNEAPALAVDAMITSWQEANLDLSFRNKLGTKATVLTGVNVFNYSNPVDNNDDNFTDVALQKRLSVFQKWDFSKAGRVFTLAGRYFIEDRWGGEMGWQPEHRGGDAIYGESIVTDRWELIGQYQIPGKEKLMLSMSLNGHNQDSYYGNMAYKAEQNIGFSQLTWNKDLGRHKFLTGASLRYTYYDDNTTATPSPAQFWLPGLFIQDDIFISDRQNLLLGMRYDYHSAHGDILTPRIAYKWNWNRFTALRLNAGTGYRVVNLFAEEHAALTGAREVVIEEELLPEQSYNVNVNFVKQWFLKSGAYLALDASSWYTYFTNQIIPDYDSDPNKIIYDNLNGQSVSMGVSFNLDLRLPNGISGRVGFTHQQVEVEEEIEEGRIINYRPVLTENWSATWALSYTWYKKSLSIDYTGNLYGPMRLPLLGPLDPRDEFSPWWSIQNIQLTYAPRNKAWEIYGGVKNLLNFTPPANSIARPFDPFDEDVQFAPDGSTIPTPSNPNALTFDPSYVYAPNQGIRVFIGIRIQLQNLAKS